MPMHCGDAVKWALEYDLSHGAFHSMFCDPPYHLNSITKRFAKTGGADRARTTSGPHQRTAKGFMNQEWDGGDIAFQPETWAAFMRVLHPGAFCMAFAGSRGVHRQACAIEDAGFILHASIMWVTGSSFPKSTRIDTQIDRDAGVDREVVGVSRGTGKHTGLTRSGGVMQGEYPHTDLAKAWAGHRYGGQVQKNSCEPILVFQKPYEGRPVDCIVRTGAGSLNIDAGRIGTNGESPTAKRRASGYATNMEQARESEARESEARESEARESEARESEARGKIRDRTDVEKRAEPHPSDDLGRWPSTFILGNKEACDTLDRQSGMLSSGHTPATRGEGGYAGGFKGQTDIPERQHNSGYASRYFFQVQNQVEEADPFLYCPKAGSRERDLGLDDVPSGTRFAGQHNNPGRTFRPEEGQPVEEAGNRVGNHNSHPT